MSTGLAFHLEPVGADHAGQRIAGLEPFALMGKHLLHFAGDRRADHPPLDRLLGRLDLDPFARGVERRQPPLELGLLDLEARLFPLQLEPLPLHLRDGARDPDVRILGLPKGHLGHALRLL